MAETFNLITRKQAQKLDEYVGVGTSDFYNEFSGLTGEVVLRCAQSKHEWGKRKGEYGENNSPVRGR